MPFSSLAQVQQAWVARYNNGMPAGTNQAVKMALDTNGNIYLTGFSQNTNNNLGYITIKYAPNGSQTWAARFDSTNYPLAAPTSMALDASNNVIVTGYGVTVKYGTNGAQLWTAPGANPNPMPVDSFQSNTLTPAVAVDPGCNVYLTGFGTNFNTAKLSPNGSNLWAVSYKDRGVTVSQTVMVDSQTNLYVAGSDTWLFYGDPNSDRFSSSTLLVRKYDSNGNLLWNTNGLTPDDEPVVVIAGAALDNANNCYILYNPDPLPPFETIKFSNNGVVAWSVSADPTVGGYSLGISLTLDKLNDVLITGRADDYPYSQYGTYKLSTNGSVVWSALYPDDPTATNSATAILVDRAQNIYVTGVSTETNSYNNIVTIKYDNNGNQIWLQSYSSPSGGNAAPNAIALDGNGNVYVAGYETTSAGGTETVLLKYAPTLSGSVQTNGWFHLQSTGEPGETWDIQASTNLHSWLDLGPSSADTNGNLNFLDTNAPLYNARFYIATPQ